MVHQIDVAIIGYDDGLGALDRLPAIGCQTDAEAWEPVDSVGMRWRWFRLTREPIRHPDGRGLADDAQIQVTPTLFTPWAGYEAAVRASNPDATAVLPNAIGVRPKAGVTDQELVVRINDASGEADALTRQQAADEAPGVAQVRQSFQVIFLLYGLVVPLVTGLLFDHHLPEAASLTLL